MCLVPDILNAYFFVHQQIMNILRSWREQKILLKRKFPILEDDDFKFELDDLEAFMRHLSTKLEKTREELDLIFAEIQRT